MNRRKVLLALPLLASGAVVSYSAFKWISWNTPADTDYLKQSLPLLASITDTIIPKTDSPSASECGVHEFIVKMVNNCADIKEQNKFISGLKEMERHTASKYGKSFSACTEADRQSVLLYFSEDEKALPGIWGKAEMKLIGKSFMSILKEYCIIGYCTSEGGATQALRYSHIPSHYTACQPYQAGEKAWATF